MKLDLFLKGIWYDKIESGEKTHEYREIKPYWIKRISITKDKNNDLGEICFDICLGDRL